MAHVQIGWRKSLFLLVFALWLATAIPPTIFAFFTLEPPLWPSFSEESTTEGIVVWAVYAAWFYITPMILFVPHHRNRMTASRPDDL
jgi:hypothetical protein